MKSYEFRIGLCEGCQGIDIPAQEWEKNGLEYELSGTVVIIMDTEAWDEFPDDMPLVLGGNSRLYDLFLDWLDTSFDLRGKAISSALFSPRQLYEALVQGWPHGFAVDGELPPDGGGNRDEWLENRSEDDIFESAQVRTPTNIAENISRGREAMKHVIATGGKDYHAMYREELGWIAFSWGEPGTPPPDFQDKKEAAEWWAKLPGKTNGQKGSKVFAGGYGVSHIIAKRDWEAKWMNRFAWQSGKDVALMCVEVLARGNIQSEGRKRVVTRSKWRVSLVPDSRWIESKDLRSGGKKKEEYWILSGFEVVDEDGEYGIFEAVDVVGSRAHQSHPTHAMPTVTRHGVGATNPQISAGGTGGSSHPARPTHSMLFDACNEVGAADFSENIMPENSSIFNNKAEGQTMPGILEKASPVVHNVESEVRAATTFQQIADIFKRLFGTVLPPQNDAYKDEGSDYGLKVSGKKARERINAQCKAILERVQGNPELLTEEDRELLRQYSGRGGTSENSQYEYYTPKHVAEGVWDALKAHGFENGNVLDPCCGAGIFSGTKPEGVIVSGNDLDPVGSGVAALLNPEDRITTRPFEEVVVSTEDNTFDSAIGNVPFGSARGKSMHIDSAYKGEKKIERYFLLRALDKIKPGGLACFVCPTNIVGNKGRKWEEFRIALSKKAEFLGAHKLPSKTFSAQGTDTVVDIVVLRKHGADLLKRLQGDEIPSDALKAANVIWEEFVSGMYWQGEGRRFIMGTYTPKVPGERFSRETVDGDIDNASMKQKLAQKFSSRINWELLNAAEPVLRAYTDGDRRYINGDPYEYRNGEWIKVEAVARETSIDASRFGASSVEELSSLLKDPAGALELTVDNAFSVYKAYPELLSQQQKNAVEFAMAQGRDEAREQVYRGSILGAMLVKLGADEEGGEDVSSRRQALQEAIVSEIEKYGHPANNPKLTLTGQSSRAFGAFMNSIDTQGNFSALLAGTLDKATAKGYVEDNLADIVVHLQKLQGDQIELEDVKALYKGAAPLESLGDLAGIEGIAITPDGMLQPAARYCAGDVVSKMAALADAIGKTEDERLKSQFQKQIEEMNRKIQRVGVEDITFGLQNNWFSKKYIVEFLRENGYPDAVYGEYRDVEYEEDDGSITQRNRFVEDMDSVNGHFHLYGAGSRKPSLFPGQLEKYLNGDNISSNDKEKIQAYKEEASRLEAAFDSWMKQHLDVDELTEQYNLKFNGHVPVEYDSTPLDIDDIISGEIKPHTYQCAEVRRLSEQGAGICGFGTGLGKAQPLTAKILTPTGWRLMGDITVGDKVIGVDGKPTTVVGVFPQGEKEIFKVSFSDGSSTECCKEHLWLTQNCYERRKSSDARHYKEGSVWACAQPKVRTLEEIMDTLTWRNGEKNHSIPIVSPVEFESQDLPLDPYLLGCLLGDGGMTTRGIVFTNPDTEICDKIRELLSGYANLVSSKGKDYQYRITADGVSNPVTNVLEQLGLLGKKSYDKYIPDIYKFNSVESRIKLLNGLMDTDGYASKSGVTTQFSSSSKQLADDVVFLVQSLGGIATTKTKIPSYKDKNGERKYCHEHYIVNIRMPAEISAFSFTRKRERVLPKTKYIPVRYVTGVESVGKKPAQCIKVEHEKELYVTDDFIVTHNTTCALATAAYNYKHGRAKRTCVVVPSAVLENWYHESRIFYSEGYMRSNVLFVGLEPKVDQDGNIERRPILDEKGEAKIGKDGKPLMQDVIRFLKSKEDVYEAMWKIPQSNYSLVVMTKEKFQSIPIKPSTMKEYTDDMVKRHLMSEKEAASIADAAAKKRRSYQEDVHQAQLEGRFSDERTAKKGELPYLEDMGFDSIITDESHFFKNSLSGGDKTQGIVYVPNPVTSNIAVDMAIKSSWLRRKNNGRGIYGLTATPVTNSPVEIYNMLNLVAPKEEFESMGIHTVDDFVRFFGDIQQRMRSAVSGEIVNNDTLVGFKNLSGLRNLFRKYVNIKTVKDVDDEIHVPDAVEMEEEVDMTEEQALAYEGLRTRAKEASKNRGANKGSDSIFSIMRDMDRCTTDMDLFKRQMTFILPREHKAKMAGLLPKLPTEFSIVEKDEVTGEKITSRFDFEPKLIDNGGDSFSVIVHEQHEAAVLKAIREYGIPENEATHPLTPKYAKMVENLKKHLDAGGKQIVFTEEKSQHQKIKRLLVHNLPITEDQIAIINAEEASGDKLDKISKAYNAGSVKIVIANKKAEVGVNLQKGTTAIHHLTLPWTPASINQRNGRGVRQGNKVDSVDVYYYSGKGTFDSYRKQLLQAKAGWIGELLMGKESRAENADVAADEEMMAALTGTLEEYRAQKAAEEERRKNAAKAQLVNRLRQLTSIHSSLATLEGRRTKAKEDADYEVKAQERRIRKYEQENKGEEALKKAQEKLEKLKAKAASVDDKYDAEKKKSEAQRNMITGMLRQAGKDGSLPFDVSLIDHPENCLVSLDGEMYAIGEFLEFAEDENSNYYSRNPSGICRITGLDQTDRTLTLENVMTGSSYRVNTKKLLSYAKKVSYSASELAMKRLLAGNMPYRALHGSGLTRQQFMKNAGSVSIDGGAFVEDSAGKMILIRWESDKSENMNFVWPEPDNEDFRKRALTAYLAATKNGTSYYDPYRPVMSSLFGEEYMAEAQKYASNATATEMQGIIANAWEKYTTGKLETPEAKIAFVAIWQSDAFNSILNSALEAFKQEGYDNLVEMRSLARSYLSCKYQEILSMAADAEREMQRQHDEELRKHPDYKEISSVLRDKFSTIGLDIRYNTEDTTLSFRRRSQNLKAFSRIFLCDKNGMGGVLYKLKEPFKARFNAQFTKDWHEKAGAWWHVPATVDLEELYNFFA